MEVPGVCAICGTHGPVKTCILCGQLVCREHHDPASGACVACARKPGGVREPRAEPQNIPDLVDLPDDVGERKT